MGWWGRDGLVLCVVSVNTQGGGFMGGLMEGWDG